jgi:hypothetical protein
VEERFHLCLTSVLEKWELSVSRPGRFISTRDPRNGYGHVERKDL